MADNIREKLVELLEESTGCTYGGPYGDVVIEEEIDISDEEIARIADHLIAHGVTVQEWISVSEPPKEWRRKNGDMVNYLIYVPEFGVDIGNYAEPAKCWICMGMPCKPTHWAYLPTPPKQEG